MQLIDKSLQNKNVLQNIGLIDRSTRVILGFGMISVWFLYPIETVNIWYAMLTILGALPLISGIIGWCPTYAIFHTKSCGMDGHNTCGTFPDQLNHMIRPKNTTP